MYAINVTNNVQVLQTFLTIYGLANENIFVHFKILASLKWTPLYQIAAAGAQDGFQPFCWSDGIS